METKKIVAWGMIISLSIAVLTGMEAFGENAYTVSGLGMFVFGIWASIILLKK